MKAEYDIITHAIQYDTSIYTEHAYAQRAISAKLAKARPKFRKLSIYKKIKVLDDLTPRNGHNGLKLTNIFVKRPLPYIIRMFLCIYSKYPSIDIDVMCMINGPIQQRDQKTIQCCSIRDDVILYDIESKIFRLGSGKKPREHHDDFSRQVVNHRHLSAAVKTLYAILARY